MLCLVAQLCLTLCDPMDCSPRGSFVHWDSPGKNTGVVAMPSSRGIFSAQGWNPGITHWRWILYCLNHQRSPRMLQWVAYSFSRVSSWSRHETGASCIAGGFFTSWTTRDACCNLHRGKNIGLAKWFIWVIPWDVTEKSKWTFWSTQYNAVH